MLAAGWATTRYSDHRIAGETVLAAGVVVVISGWFVPRVFRWVERLGGFIARGLGVVMTWVLLVPFYYVCFVLGRIMFALSHQDPLQLRSSVNRPTFWVARQSTANVDRYQKQTE